VPKHEERKFRLRPPKPPERSERAAWASAYKILMHHARMSRRQMRRAFGRGGGLKCRPYNQRCAVRVMYAKNATAGQWRAHGRYLARESATREGDPRLSASMAAGSPSTSRSGSKAGSVQGMTASGS
jgi:hypothetical protein